MRNFGSFGEFMDGKWRWVIGILILLFAAFIDALGDNSFWEAFEPILLGVIMLFMGLVFYYAMFSK